ncbi:Uncharacterised protein [Vibrio cholerae]|nr:Uncharacterised protein [Vibrio cholerae]
MLWREIEPVLLMAATGRKASHLMAHDHLATQHKALWLNGFRFIEGRWNNWSGVRLDTDGGGVGARLQQHSERHGAEGQGSH